MNVYVILKIACVNVYVNIQGIDTDSFETAKNMFYCVKPFHHFVIQEVAVNTLYLLLNTSYVTNPVGNDGVNCR